MLSVYWYQLCVYVAVQEAPRCVCCSGVAAVIYVAVQEAPRCVCGSPRDATVCNQLSEWGNSWLQDRASDADVSCAVTLMCLVLSVCVGACCKEQSKRRGDDQAVHVMPGDIDLCKVAPLCCSSPRDATVLCVVFVLCLWPLAV